MYAILESTEWQKEGQGMAELWLFWESREEIPRNGRMESGMLQVDAGRPDQLF